MNLKSIYDEETIYKINLNSKTSELKDLKSKVVIVMEKDNTGINNEKLLEILKAINWKIGANCSLIQLTQNENFKLSDLKKLKSFQAIVFGKKPKEIGVQAHIKPYTKATFENGEMILSDSIEKVINDKNLKIQLWNSIKNWKDD